ncbi:hypothetical protein CAPTEDRAFT_221902 [Capitella teleta]|uniref:Uncharacterized protein n=1 Tax=Capitella teleta TaxID=283909 RepID=R7T3H2_CAPTE|nr:hypothetical protein CAPTEDRAFT_221902 [Capitella teleta]|eukprot:ELT87223.1 hypothetical protein CAPTEDRAFT_221902 [Capitella teleta]
MSSYFSSFGVSQRTIDVGYSSEATSLKRLQKKRTLSPVSRHQTKARLAVSASLPLQKEMRMPTTARPAQNRASGEEISPYYTPRVGERSKTEVNMLRPGQTARSGEKAISDPSTVPGMLPQSAMKPPKPFFLSEFQLPHLENRQSAFRNTVALRPRHHYIHPDWISEEMLTKRMMIEHRKNPLLFGWI